MSMTVEEAKKILERDLSVQKENKALQDGIIAMEVAITAIEEVQQYRAIGTVEGYERAIQISIENYNLYREYKAKVQEFEAIGTVSEFRELKEKATAKRKCPNCNELLYAGFRFCPTCRRKVDWSEGKE